MDRELSLKRVVVAYLLVTVAAVVLACLYGYYLMWDLYLEQTREDLEARARLCFHHVVELLEEGQVDQIDPLCKELGGATDTRITVIRPDGQVVGDSEKDPQGMENHLKRDEISQALEDPAGVGHAKRFSDTIEKTLLYVAVVARRGEQPVVVVRTSLPINAVNKKLDRIVRVVIVAGFVAVVLITAISPYVTLRISRRRQRPDATGD